MVEQFANEIKKFQPGLFEATILNVWPAPAKTAKKAEIYNKEGPINVTVCKSGVSMVFFSSFFYSLAKQIQMAWMALYHRN